MEAKSSSGAGRPVKGILKNRSGDGGGSGLTAAATSSTSSSGLVQASDAAPARPRPGPPRDSEGLLDEHGKKCQKWDEMNILATYHPAGKDYGLMKIDEPSTPYHRIVGEDEDGVSDTESNEALTADVLANKLAAAVEGKGPKVLAQPESSDEEEDDEDLTPEEREKKKQFEMKRKMHYNEAQNIKLARQLIEKELRGEAANEEEEGDNENDEEMQDTAGSGTMSPELAPAPSDPLENIAHSLEEVCSGL